MSTPEELPSPETLQSVFRESLPLQEKLERARTELLDLSARNRLLNIPRAAKSGRSIDVVDEKSAEVYRLLVKEGKAFTFLAGREARGTESDSAAEKPQSEEVAELAQPEDTAVDDRGVFARHSDTRLQTRLTSQGLQKRLLELFTDAVTLEQEQGVNILYLALGTMKWVDPKDASLVRYAPLLLVPVSLERGTAAERFKLRARAEDVSSNLSLEAYLDRVHKIRLPEIDDTEDFDPRHYMQAVAACVSSKEGWLVAEDDIVLGFFSFAKFLMYRDLDPECWPEAATIADQPLVRSLLSDGFAEQDALIPEDANLDELLRPGDMVHIVDCDSSQALAVHEARSGKNLVIQGPPGTGKSQTIANVIASAVADGKTVLFVAEKMAALEVVKRRLDQAGVGDACLELHSNKANKRQLLQELSRTWDLASPRGTPEESLESSLLSVRDELNAFVGGMHQPADHACLTPYQVIGELSRLHAEGVPPAVHELSDAASWTPEQRREREAVLDDLRERIALIGHPAEHPWRGVDLPPMLPTDVTRLTTRMEALLAPLQAFLAQAASLSQALQSEEPAPLNATKKMEQMALRVAGAPAMSGTALRSDAWTDTSTVEALLSKGRAFDEIRAALEGKAQFEAVSHQDVPQLELAIQTLNALPQGFTEAQVGTLNALLDGISPLREAAARVTRMIGRSEALDTLSSIELLLQVAEQIVSAPAVAAGSFASPRWESEVERANDVAEALAILEKAKQTVGNQVSDAAWQTDFTEARRVLAEYGGGFTRFFSSRWRQQNRFVNSFLANPKAPLAHTPTLLDELQRGRAAAADIEREKEFGSEIFGPEWRGARSASAHLLALTGWMRGLARFPLVSDRSMVRARAAARAENESLQREIATLRALSAAFRSQLSLVSDAVPSHATFDALRDALNPLVAADQTTCRLVTSRQHLLNERLVVLRSILDFLHLRRELRDGRSLGINAFDTLWRDEFSGWEELTRIASWIGENQDIRWIAGGVDDRAALSMRAAEIARAREDALQAITGVIELLHWTLLPSEGGPAPETLFLRPLEARLGIMLREREQLSHWTSYQDRSKHANALGLAGFVEGLENGTIAAENLLRSFHASYFESLLRSQLAAFPQLARFDGALQDRSVGSFRSMDVQHIKAAALKVARAHHRRIPPSGGIGPVGILRGEIARRRGHMPIRQLMLKAAPVVQALKPVIMMSPLSVAQFLSPGHMTFDVLVMDEASQIQPVDALGAIARCRQLVVVGDERQLPPTKFFSKITSESPDSDDDSGAAEVGDVESVLGLCLARGLPQRMLRWHYRSRHQSLIAVSNSQFYENKLRIIPSPYTKEAGTGLRFLHIANGVFESGATGANPIEAKAVAEAVIRHALDHPEQSLGVATFSVRQRKAIQDHLEAMRRLNPLSEAFFSAHPSEPFFIKNLENVQGDERDVIFISVGYGRNENGFFAMRFGPLGTDGGERRLNVLISRAKRRCDVFASITDEDIDTERAKGKGVLAFKLFLHYARTGHLQMVRFSTEEYARNTLAKLIEQEIQRHGYQTHPNVGLSGLFIDIAVADPDRPGRYVLGVELDGPSYANAQSARDRDRLRNAVLRDHGWHLHRIWSMDWLQRPTEQSQRLIQAIEEARNLLRNESSAQKPQAVPVEIVVIERGDVAEVGLQEIAHKPATAYEEATLQAVPTDHDLASTPPAVLARFVADVVTVEGPVHRDEVIVRIRTAWNLARSGGRIQSALDGAMQKALADGTIAGDTFLYVPGRPVVPRDRSAVISAGLRRVDMLPPTEIDAAIQNVIEVSMGGTPEEVVQSVSRMLGFRITSAQLREAILGQVEALKLSGKVVARDGMICLSGT